jgi:hypothetical protein
MAEHTDLTRELCGAAYLSDRFTYQALRALLPSRSGPVGVTPGLDLVLLLRHCLTAQRIHAMYSALFTVLLAATITAFLLARDFMLLGLVVAFALSLLRRAMTDREVRRRFEPERFRRDSGAPGRTRRWMQPHVDRIERAQRANVTVFSGLRPFLGHGIPLEGWSFALALEPSGGPARRFDAAELITHLHSTLADIAAGGERAILAGLSLETRVFVAQRWAPKDVDLTEEQILAVANQPDNPARVYLTAHRWTHNGLAASTFIRFAVDDHILFAEFERAVLPPLSPELRVDDRISRAGGWSGALRDNEVGSALVDWAALLFLSPYRLLRVGLLHALRPGARRPGRRSAKADEKARQTDWNENPKDMTARELASAAGYDNLFQTVDTEKHFKTVERQTLATLVRFLTEHGFDVSELRNRQTAIINHGIIQTGGTTIVGALAVGDRARAGQSDRSTK